MEEKNLRMYHEGNRNIADSLRKTYEDITACLNLLGFYQEPDSKMELVRSTLTECRNALREWSVILKEEENK